MILSVSALTENVCIDNAVWFTAGHGNAAVLGTQRFDRGRYKASKRGEELTKADVKLSLSHESLCRVQTTLTLLVLLCFTFC